MRPYSRYATLEEKRNIRRAFIFGVSTLVLIGGIFFFGLPVVARFAGMIAGLKSSGKPVDVADTTPPGPPHFNTLPEAVNKESLEVEGTSEAGATVTIYLNDQGQDVVVGSGGDFSHTFKLAKGDNTLHALAKDTAGNESKKTQLYNVIYDTELPTLEITQPNDGASFSGSTQRQITILGKVSEGASLTINDRITMVSSDGSFTYLTSLNEGTNSFTLKAADLAGNSAEKSLSVSFSP
jgi:hypothetical protein